MPVVYRGVLGQKLTIAQLDGNFQTIVTDIAGVTASLSLGLPGTNDFQFIFLSAGVTYSATFSFVDGILATHSTPFAI